MKGITRYAESENHSYGEYLYSGSSEIFPIYAEVCMNYYIEMKIEE